MSVLSLGSPSLSRGSGECLSTFYSFPQNGDFGGFCCCVDSRVRRVITFSSSLFIIICASRKGELNMEDAAKPRELMTLKEGDVAPLIKGTTIKHSSPTKCRGISKIFGLVKYTDC